MYFLKIPLFEKIIYTIYLRRTKCKVRHIKLHNTEQWVKKKLYAIFKIKLFNAFCTVKAFYSLAMNVFRLQSEMNCISIIIIINVSNFFGS